MTRKEAQTAGTSDYGLSGLGQSRRIIHVRGWSALPLTPAEALGGVNRRDGPKAAIGQFRDRRSAQVVNPPHQVLFRLRCCGSTAGAGMTIDRVQRRMAA